MTITSLKAFKDNYIWIIFNQSKQSFLCVDPGDAGPVLNYSKKHQLQLTDILITHHHYDHAGGIAELLQAFPNTSVYGPKDKRLPEVNQLAQTQTPITIDSYTFYVLSTPGHTSSHICYFEPNKHWLFCGDTLFSAGCGRVFDGTLEALYDSLNLLKTLPEDTQVFCAHEYTRENLAFAKTVDPDNSALKTHAAYLSEHNQSCSLPSTIRLEKEINPFLRTEAPGLKAFARQAGIDPYDSFEIFKQLRLNKDEF